ncbi:MAG: hypothetical protein RIQ71_2197 [Verrucomicrobiota bacterium]|jgi:hypothetical protein
MDCHKSADLLDCKLIFVSFNHDSKIWEHTSQISKPVNMIFATL